MNTFLPYQNFYLSAKSLDWRRLQKQVTEGLQLCNLICRLTNLPLPKRYEVNTGKGWKHHPVLNLWSSPEGTYYLRELVYYVDICEIVWNNNPHCRKRHVWRELSKHFLEQDNRVAKTLIWSDDFHKVMRANLVRKDPKFYGARFGPMEPREGYIWEHPLR